MSGAQASLPGEYRDHQDGGELKALPARRKVIRSVDVRASM
jgi:hypothetical protein